MKSKKLWGLALVLVVVLGIAYILYSKVDKKIFNQALESEQVASSVKTSSKAETSVENKETSDNQAPDITLAGLQGLKADGSKAALDTFNGKPKFVNIWASWCPPCQEEFPELAELYAEYGDKVDFYFINATGSRADETIEKAEQYLQQEGLKVPAYYDQDYQIMTQLGASVLPSNLIFDKDGKLILYHPGQVSKEDIAAKLDQLLQ